MHSFAYISALVHKLYHTVVTSVFFHNSLAHWICIEASRCITVMQWFSRGSVIALDNLSLWQVENFPQSTENTVSWICVGLYIFLSKKTLRFSWLHELHVNFCRFRKKKYKKSPWADILTAALFLILILWGLSVSHIRSGAEGGTSSLVLVKCHFHVPVLPEDRLNLYFLLLKLQVSPVILQQKLLGLFWDAY